MPIHDWARVEAGIFHAFHHDWVTEIARALNRGLLPSDYYALPEQIAGGLGPDVLTLHRPASDAPPGGDPAGGVLLANAPPRAQWRFRAEPDQYAAKAKAVVLRHASSHQVIAILEIVSPGSKNTRHGLRAFVDKAVTVLRAGVHLLIVDLFPPVPRAPQGTHKAIWDELVDNEFELPPDKPLTLAAYIGGPCPEAFVQPTAVGSALTEMPLFLTPDVNVPVPLETTYQSAFEGLASFWRNVLTSPPAP
jgi:hypothetical protein